MNQDIIHYVQKFEIGICILVDLRRNSNKQIVPLYIMKNILIIAKLKTFEEQLSTNRYNFLCFLNTKNNIKVIDDTHNEDIYTIISHYQSEKQWYPDYVLNYAITALYGWSNVWLKNFANLNIPKVLFVDDFQHTEIIKTRVLETEYSHLIISTKHESITATLDDILPSSIQIHNYDYYVDTNIFRDYQLEKKWDILLYGSTIPEFYPFRHRLKNILYKLQKIYRIKIIEHPGYDKKISDLKKKYVDEDLAKLINQSHFTIATKSIYDRLLKKYLEIPLCNSIIMGNIPTDYANIFRPRNSLILTNIMSDNEILQRIEAGMRYKHLYNVLPLQNLFGEKNNFNAGYQKITKILC